MVDDKILDIKDYKKVNGEVTKITKKSKKSKKKSKEEPVVETPQDLYEDFEYVEDLEDDYEEMLIEENELLHVELLKERTARQALEKLLNKYLKDGKKEKKSDDKTDPDTNGSRQP